jgi:hypothetical protein
MKKRNRKLGKKVLSGFAEKDPAQQREWFAAGWLVA